MNLASLAKYCRVVILGICISWQICPAVLTSAEEADFTEQQLTFFESKVRPLLVAHCYECHSQEAKAQSAHLRLDGRAWMIQGGDSGAAMVPGKPEESPLVRAIRYEDTEMPPENKLPDEKIEVLVKWIEMGAPWPAERSDLPQSVIVYDWAALRQKHWAWQPVVRREPPSVQDKDWPQSEIDFFVLAKLEAAHLQPSPPADPRTLLRRIHFDLIGLPPAPEEVQQFVSAVASDRAAAISELIDRLLASPHYGERWGRHWLDVARYSDGFGGFLDNAALPQAWRYRDWVVDAVNQDMPYDQFVRLQIAGDLIDPEHRGGVATGFFALGPTYISDGGDPDSIAQAKSESLDDRVDTLTRGFLGLTVSCARCHDHKFDPVPQLDYYSLAGVFNNTQIQETPLASAAVVTAFQQHQQVIQAHDKQIAALREKAKSEQRELNAAETTELQSLQAKLEDLRKNEPPAYDTAHGLVDSGSADMHVALRGNLLKPGEIAPRRFLRMIAGEDAKRFERGSGRLDLAQEIVGPNNPLTARVMANRIWMHHFGQAIVRTPSNFGTLGEQPTHPELLDWLAAEFVQAGWSLKHMHRSILSSATYQMSSQFEQTRFAADGDNRWLWRMHPRRLDVEAWRDSLLAVTGELDAALGGPPSDNLDSRRRTLYFQVSRNGDRFAADEFLRLFDFPLMRATVAQRVSSVVPQQFLFMINSPFMIGRSDALAQRIEACAGSQEQGIVMAYQLLFQREPSAEESRLANEFFAAAQSAARQAQLSPWQRYAQILLGSNEFMYVP